MNDFARKAGAEFLATLLFVFAIITAVAEAGPFAPVAIGLALMVLVYATGHISGGHLNPAVSLGAWIRGAMTATEMLIYWVAQALGAISGALICRAVLPVAEESAQIQTGSAFIVEALFTFILVFVVLNVATAKANDGNSFYGLAIGATVMTGAFAVGPISGGGFNPAVALGLSVNGNFGWGNLWIYILAPFVGAALAALCFRVLSPADHEHDLQA
ncbi:MIP/aquaporin family protein [Corynebacterium urinipleomorphum]|uniref:MIP/aquaporin family protein n=1 Tax=Corynebacterium urinipleomorphum TaxID=1852380 RepID=UPI000B352505|nr:aquaporin [Corynebacterium urinipleomorphum]